MTALVLGGTSEARRLAELLVHSGVPVTTSLAGAVTDPRLPTGQIRIGGFGGATGLADYLRVHEIAAVVDATHPFAHRITANAAAACAATGVPWVRLVRPSWGDRPDAASWHWVDSLAEAREVARRWPGRAFLAVGRQSLRECAEWTGPVLARVVAAPDIEVPADWEIISARGPFTLADERRLLREHAISVLVTKDSGGVTAAKLDAAGEQGIPVVIVRRPPGPPDAVLLRSIAEALAWVLVALAG